MKILFVCSGNQCRSPFAEAIFRHILTQNGITGIEVGSAGTISMGGEKVSENTFKIAAEMGLNLSSHSARRVTGELVVGYDRILVMEKIHRETISKLCPQVTDRISLLGSFAPTQAFGDEIPDPGLMDPFSHRTCFSRIIEAVHLFYYSLRKEMNIEKDGNKKALQ